MPALTQYSKSGSNFKTQTPNTMTASDTLTYQPGTGQELYLVNRTAGALTPVINGSGNVALPAPQGGTVNYPAGIGPGSIPAGGSAFVRLDDIPGYLNGTITITGGTGLTALLMGP